MSLDTYACFGGGRRNTAARSPLLLLRWPYIDTPEKRGREKGFGFSEVYYGNPELRSNLEVRVSCGIVGPSAAVVAAASDLFFSQNIPNIRGAPRHKWDP